MIKKIMIVLVLLSLLLSSPVPASAQAMPRSSAPMNFQPFQIGENSAIITFADLGQEDISLASPYDSTRLLFSIPPNWKLVTGGEVELTFDFGLSRTDLTQLADSRNPYGGTIVVSFNNQVIGNIPLSELGTVTVRFALPEQALTPLRPDGRHQLVIALNAEFSCVYDVRAIITIKNTSLFDLRFEASSPLADLSKLPAPFYLRDAMIPDTTLLVVPDSPTEQELQSAMNIMAGFGSMIGQDYSIRIVQVGNLAENDLQENNLVFVGKPAGFNLLSNVQFPIPVTDGQLSSLPSESVQDGILEMALSPWNTNKMVLFISGGDDQGVAKAAQAVSSGQVIAYENPALAYVSDVRSQEQNIPLVEELTFEGLGYSNETLSDIGTNFAEYKFFVASEQVASKDGTISLLYYHSSLLDYGVSSLRVRLNGQIVGSAIFNKDSEQLTTLNIRIPTGILRFGENRLEVTGRLNVQTTCDTSGFSNPWLVISNQSSLHLPAAAVNPLAAMQAPDLKLFPDMFLTRSDLGDLAFVLPKENAFSWDLAGQIAYEMGRDVNPPISSLRVAYADNVPAEIRDGYSMILIGKASELAFLSEFNDGLPAPFDMATDTASERDMQVVYRIPAGVSVGYLETFRSPYNSEKLMMIAAGNDDRGLALAGNALMQAELKSQLAGQFAVTNGTQVATSSSLSQFSVVGEVVPGAEQVVTTPVPQGNASNSGFNRPSWLTILPIASAGLILLIIIYVIATSAVRRRKSLPEADEKQ